LTNFFYSLKNSRFDYWCSKLRLDFNSPQHVQQAQTSKSAFIPLQPPSVGKSFMIVVSSGLKLEFDSLPGLDWIARFIGSMDSLHDQH